MSFMDGFILRAGESSRERNMLDIQNKIAKHKAFTDHIQKISEDPAYSPDAQEAAKKRWLEAVSTDPLKFKKYDISDILTVTNPRMVGVPNAPRNERPPILPSGSEGRTLFEGWEKTLPGSPGYAAETYKSLMQDDQVQDPYQPSGGEPHQFGDIFMYTPKQNTGYDPATRSGKWTPEEAAYLEAQTAGLKYANTIATKPTGYVQPGTLDGRAQTSGADLINAGHTETANGTPIDPNKVYITGTNRNSRQFFIGEAVAPRYSQGPTFTTPEGQSVPSSWNPQQGVATPSQVPTGHQMQVPTHTVAISDGGKWYEYAVEDATNRPVVDADGEVNLVERVPDAAWAPQMASNVAPVNTGGAIEFFERTTATQRQPPANTLVPSSAMGRMTLGGIPVKINGKPIRFEDGRNRSQAPQTAQGVGMATMGGPPTPPPPAAGVPPTTPGAIGQAIVPGVQPAGGNTSQEQMQNRTQPIRYNPANDRFIGIRPDLERDSPTGQLPAIASPRMIPNSIVVDPSLETASDPNNLKTQKYMVRVARPTDSQARISPAAGVHTAAAGPVRPTVKPMTENQIAKIHGNAVAMNTTAELLTTILDPKILAATQSVSNRLRAIAATPQNHILKTASSILSNLDPFISEEEKTAIRLLATTRENLTEHVQVIRTPLGAAGFRSLEAFWALQRQYGDLFMDPRIAEGVIRNTLKTVLTIKAAYDKAINISRRSQRNLDGGMMAGPNYPSAEIIRQYYAAYPTPEEADQAMLRDGYEAPPLQ